jgi:hypothetical protein
MLKYLLQSTDISASSVGNCPITEIAKENQMLQLLLNHFSILGSNINIGFLNTFEFGAFTGRYKHRCWIFEGTVTPFYSMSQEHRPVL